MYFLFIVHVSGCMCSASTYTFVYRVNERKMKYMTFKAVDGGGTSYAALLLLEGLLPCLTVPQLKICTLTL